MSATAIILCSLIDVVMVLSDCFSHAGSMCVCTLTPHNGVDREINLFIANLFPKLSHIHNDIQYLEKENAEVVQLMNAFPFNNYTINETL